MAPKKKGRRGRRKTSPKEGQDIPAKGRETPKEKRDITGKSSSIADIFLWLVVTNISHGESPAKKGEKKERDEFGDEVEFTTDLKVQWTNGPSWEDELSEGWFREKDLQGLNQTMVLQYWEDKGAIHDERMDAKSHRKSYQVQLVGYRNDLTTG
ncbi:hypothetical protein NCS57_00486200 [Fusarium keratoplasticum]|uniref:Uncharacterized protein n=1 Tax=Fusarium keratoplasticum TaxID=1328300 RepID=A0ACC0R877_9HYPO|nr:hypothetical protein NCS57_00486200 [Fusarium keratoplasticum]KAI8675837.1 hypothetical protein NCS57_00486200 [Fusarium keratoplasticum]